MSLDEVRAGKQAKVEYLPISIEWEIIEQEPNPYAYDENGRGMFKTISSHKAFNLVTNGGRQMIMQLLFALTGAVASTMVYMGVGVSGVADDGVTTNPLVTDTHLYYELNAEQRKTVTDIAGNPPAISDVTLNTTTIGGCTFYSQITLQAVWPSGSASNNNTFVSYALFTCPGPPATPSGTSGVMFNELFDPTPLPKSSGNQITAQMTIRF